MTNFTLNYLADDIMTMEENMPLWTDNPCNQAENDENKKIEFPDNERITDNVPVNETTEETKVCKIFN